MFGGFAHGEARQLGTVLHQKLGHRLWVPARVVAQCSANGFADEKLFLNGQLLRKAKQARGVGV